MSRNYDWNYDKENSYDFDLSLSSKAKPPSVTNSSLRRKIDDNLTLIQRDRPNQPQPSPSQQEIYKPEECGSVAGSRRDNARKRGFDMRVSNIENISEKIAGLLNMVKKDRGAERAEEKREEKRQEELQEDRQGDKSPNFGVIDRSKWINRSNKSNNATERVPARQQPQVSKFSQPRPQQYDRKRVVFVLQQSNSQEQNIRQIRMRYLQQQRKPRQAQTSGTPIRRSKQEESWRNEMPGQRIQGGRAEIKKEANRTRPEISKAGANSSSYQKTDIEKMLEQRRKQRFNYGGQVQRDRSLGAYNNRSVLKGRENRQGKIIQNKQKQSPILAVKRQLSDLGKGSDESSRMPSPSPTKRRTDYSNLVQISYLQQQPIRQQRATRLIDQQLRKIKSKIHQSQTNKRKIQSFTPPAGFQSRGKVHTSRIAESISKQVEFDARLRPARQAFCKLQGEGKWQQLQQGLLTRRLSIEGDELRQLIAIGADEHNPFADERGEVGVQELAELVANAEKNWANCVLKCASVRSLKGENFEVADLDLSGKGFLGLEDLVCFVNLYANTFYRNRDLALVLRRLQMGQGASTRGGIDYEGFLEAFAG